MGGPLLCPGPAASWWIDFSTFPLPFPLLKLFFYFLSFFHLIIRNFLSLETTLWSTIVCLFGGSTIVPSCFLRWFFKTFPLPFPLLFAFPFTFPLLKRFFFQLYNYFLSFFHLWNSQKCPIFQNIWCHIKTQ